MKTSKISTSIKYPYIMIPSICLRFYTGTSTFHEYIIYVHEKTHLFDWNSKRIAVSKTDAKEILLEGICSKS